MQLRIIHCTRNDALLGEGCHLCNLVSAQGDHVLMPQSQEALTGSRHRYARPRTCDRGFQAAWAPFHATPGGRGHALGGPNPCDHGNPMTGSVGSSETAMAQSSPCAATQFCAIPWSDATSSHPMVWPEASRDQTTHPGSRSPPAWVVTKATMRSPMQRKLLIQWEVPGFAFRWTMP